MNDLEVNIKYDFRPRRATHYDVSPDETEVEDTAEPETKLETKPETDGANVIITARALQQQPPSTPRADHYANRVKKPRKGRTPHHVVEQRYRDAFNSSIDALRTALPAPILESQGVREKADATKAVVLAAAIRHIRTLQIQREQLRNKVWRLQQSVMVLQGQSHLALQCSSPLCGGRCLAKLGVSAAESVPARMY